MAGRGTAGLMSDECFRMWIVAVGLPTNLSPTPPRPGLWCWKASGTVYQVHVIHAYLSVCFCFICLLLVARVPHPAGWNAALHTLSSRRAALSCRLDRASHRRSTLSVPPVTNHGRLGCGARARQDPVCPCQQTGMNVYGV